MLSEARRAHPLETGGILVGYRGAKEAAVVTQVVGPGPRAIHGPDVFEPDYGFQERILERIHFQSEGVERYLGDWHTHPDGRLELSSKDLSVLRQISDFAEAGIQHPLMLIIAIGAPTTATMWRYTPSPAPVVDACEIILE